MNTRTERDSLGDVLVPADALYAAQTQRAVDNFDISGKGMSLPFIQALLNVKKAAANANVTLELLPPDIGDAINQAIDQLMDDPSLPSHFPVDVFQTGSGTSSNMNANEVIATLATRNSGLDVHPNDHVNCSQSSNDVIPTTIHVAATIALSKALLPALHHTIEVTRQKARSTDHLVKTGRTHLMDAMPIRLGQALDGWADQLDHNRVALEAQLTDIQHLAQGGTAVGTGINVHADFPLTFCTCLNSQTGLAFQPAQNFFTHIGSQDTAVRLSGALKATAVSLMKISNDLRWMNSGPLSGLGEIELQALQPGSSIMPGKVNPVIPEAVCMVAAKVMGNDTTIAIGGQSGNFELNVMLPVIADCLLESIGILANASRTLADKAIASFQVNEGNIQASLARNPILVTALNREIGYAKAAEIAKRAYREGRAIVDVAADETDLSVDELTRLLDPMKLTSGGL
ncbi:MAG: class II fumarate hydratase [Pseudomonadota bacterium]